MEIPEARVESSSVQAWRAEIFERLLTIRRLEESLLDLYSKGKLLGTTHTSIGQEAIAVAVMNALDLEADVVFSPHRCHGHFLAYGGDLKALIAEVMGRSTGVCGGIGGSQHLQFKNFHSNGVQGGIVPLAVGAALAELHKKTDSIAVVFLGDGTLGEGVVYEALNMASLWSIPTLFIVEDNMYAQSTPRKMGVAGSISARAEAFGIECDEIETDDVEELIHLMHERVCYVRFGRRPFFQVVHTYRLAPHSKGDDDRDPEEVAGWRKRDPLEVIRKRLDIEAAEAIEGRVRNRIDAAIKEAEAEVLPTAASVSELISLEQTLIPGEAGRKVFAEPDLLTGKITVGRELNAALHELMAVDERVIIIGEDLIDPYGGAFKITKGLSSRFRSRIYTTPISEAGLVGIANGLALRGMRPVAEIMFGDFIALAADQIVNHAAKFEGMYNRQVTCPLTIRTPMGGRRGYGPTHSQSLESLFFSVPGLEVVAPSPVYPAGELLYNAVLNSERPTLFIENKLMYTRHLRLQDESGHVGPFAVRYGRGAYPTVHLSIDGFRSCDLVLITYGGSVELALEAAERLMVDEEIACDVLVPSQIAPLALGDLIAPVLKVGRALILEEGVRTWGWGAEVAAALYEEAGTCLAGGSIRRIGARSFPLPVSRPLEDLVLPQVDDIIRAARSITGG